MTIERRLLVLRLAWISLAACGAPPDATPSTESSSAARAVVSTTIHIDTNRIGSAIPPTYVGMSITRKNISGQGGDALFDPARNPAYAELLNLVKQVRIRHLRTVSGDAKTEEGDPTAEEDDNFFRFAKAAGLGERSIIYSLHLFNEEDHLPGTSNTISAKHIWGSPYRSMIESFALDNEPDWKGRYHLDPNIRGYFPSRGSIGYRDAWTRRYDEVQAALGRPVPPAAFSGPDTGSNYPVSTDAASNTSIDGTPFTLRFAIDHRHHIDLATQHYYGGSNQGTLTAREMAEAMLDPMRLDDWQKLLDHALAGARTWPGGLRFRLTESNAFSGGLDPGSQCFATALWSLEYFHWWAAHGSVGVDPFTRVVQYNAPIFLDTRSGAFMAEPYAYGMLAFALGSEGTTVRPEAVSFSSKIDRVTAYAVVNSAHLYVTIVNKTFNSVGAKDASIVIHADGFVAKQARALELASAPGQSGDASVTSATLGGAKIPNAGDWSGTWTSVPVRGDGSIGPVSVPSTSAFVIDVTRQ
jgi:hypothetical protein